MKPGFFLATAPAPEPVLFLQCGRGAFPPQPVPIPTTTGGRAVGVHDCIVQPAALGWSPTLPSPIP